MALRTVRVPCFCHFLLQNWVSGEHETLRLRACDVATVPSLARAARKPSSVTCSLQKIACLDSLSTSVLYEVFDPSTRE